MQTSNAYNICNYNKNFNKKKELFEFLLERFPKEETLYAFSKRDLKFKRKAPAREALQKGKFLHYNTHLITELIFDIDNLRNSVCWDLDWVYRAFYEKFNLPIAWSCKTDKGIQFCISLNTFYPLTRKQQKLLRDFKEFIADSWNNFIDKAGSVRLKGWWRNPLTQTDFRFYGNVLTFEEIKNFLLENKLNVKQQFKAKVRQEQIKQAKKQTINNKIRLWVGEPVIGNRNNFVFYNTMLNTNSKKTEDILKIAEELNKKCEEKLSEQEIEHIVKNVRKYNRENKNFIYSNSKKAKWNIGAMGFTPIRGLSFEDYLNEVRRRQSMAGREIGKKNLIKRNEQKAQEAKEKVFNAIKQLKESGEKVTIMKIKDLAQVSINTARKYLKKAKEEGIV